VLEIHPQAKEKDRDLHRILRMLERLLFLLVTPDRKITLPLETEIKMVLEVQEVAVVLREQMELQN
jgi:hypothetical protein